jgi:hypothetical protein
MKAVPHFQLSLSSYPLALLGVAQERRRVALSSLFKAEPVILHVQPHYCQHGKQSAIFIGSYCKTQLGFQFWGAQQSCVCSDETNGYTDRLENFISCT